MTKEITELLSRARLAERQQTGNPLADLLRELMNAIEELSQEKSYLEAEIAVSFEEYDYRLRT